VQLWKFPPASSVAQLVKELTLEKVPVLLVTRSRRSGKTVKGLMGVPTSVSVTVTKQFEESGRATGEEQLIVVLVVRRLTAILNPELELAS